MDLNLALLLARPGAVWTLPGGDLSKIQWQGPGAIPTQQELQTAYDAYLAKTAVDAAAEPAQSAKEDALKTIAPALIKFVATLPGAPKEITDIAKTL